MSATEYIAADSQNAKIVCNQEIEIFLGSGRLQNWKNRREVALSGRYAAVQRMPLLDPTQVRVPLLLLFLTERPFSHNWTFMVHSRTSIC